MDYYLMNKDDKLLSFKTEYNLGDIVVYEKERYTKRLPIGFTDISLWIENRNYAKHKDSLSSYLRDWGIDSVEGFIDITHCLGLNDTLWVKPVESSLHWDEVSLYTNEFSDVMEKTAFGNGLNGIEISSTDLTSPEFVSPGSFAKCWRRETDGIYLYKTTGSLSQGLEPYSEFFASQIANNFAVPTVNYELTRFNGRLCTRCKMFTSEKVGLVSFAGVYDITKKKYNIPAIIESCKKMGIEEEIRQMYMIDSLILNQDRHLGNIGFLFDNDTFEILGLSPIYDFNVSMLCDAYPEDMVSVQTIDNYIQKNNIRPKTSEATFYDVAVDLGVDLPKNINFSQDVINPMESKRYDILSEYINLNFERIKHKNKILGVINQKEEKQALDISSMNYMIEGGKFILEIRKDDFLNNIFLKKLSLQYGISDDEKIIVGVDREGVIYCNLVDEFGSTEIGDELLGDKDLFLTKVRKILGERYDS